MKRIFTLWALVCVSALALVIAPVKSMGAEGKPIVIYMQMGGDPGIASVLARTTGAKAAAKALGVELHEQYASWDTKKMIDEIQGGTFG
jgi:ABC-type sugar transport system substrate-binding protein